MHEELEALAPVQEETVEQGQSQQVLFEDAVKGPKNRIAGEFSEDPTANPEDKVEESVPEQSEVFPPNIYSSAKIPGARASQPKEDKKSLDLRIEGLLFVTDAPLTGPQISSILNVPLKDVMETLRAMIKSFARRRSALELRERIRRGRPAFVIDLKPEYRPDVRPLARPALARRYIDTLALIALNQPVPQSRLVRERGSKIYDHVRELVEHGLVHRTKKGLSYELRTTPRFASEFGLSNNPRDLKAMLARKMTEEEKATLQEYEEHQKSLQPQPIEVDEDNDSFAEATEEAARSLIADNEITVQEEAVMALPKAQSSSPSSEDSLAPLPEALDAESTPVTASSENTRVSQSPRSHSESLSYEQALGTTGSGRLKRVSFADHGEPEKEEPPQLTRWEMLFLKNSKS